MRMSGNERLGISTKKQDVEKFLGKDEEIKYGVFTLQRHHFGLPHSTQPILKFKRRTHYDVKFKMKITNQIKHTLNRSPPG